MLSDFHFHFHYYSPSVCWHGINCSGLCGLIFLIKSKPNFCMISVCSVALGLRCCTWAFSAVVSRAALPCSARVSCCGRFPCCEAQAPGKRASAGAALGLRSLGSVVVEHGLSCSTACGIFPDQGSNWYPLHCQADLHQRKSRGLYSRETMTGSRKRVCHFPGPISQSLDKCLASNIYWAFTSARYFPKYCGCKDEQNKQKLLSS